MTPDAGRAQASVVGVAVLLGLTVVSLGVLTASVGMVVEDHVASATADDVAAGFASAVEPGPDGRRRVDVPLGDGRLRTVERRVTVRTDGGVVARLNGSALVWTGGDRRVVAVAGAVVRGPPGAARVTSAPTVALDGDTLLLGVAQVRGPVTAVDGTGDAGATLLTNRTHRTVRRGPGSYRLTVETATPAAWERQFATFGATVGRADFDGDGVESVVARFPADRRLDLVVRNLTVDVEVRG